MEAFGTPLPEPFCHALRRPSGVHTAGTGFLEVQRVLVIARGLRFA